MMSKIKDMNVGVFFGSRSPEHDVSIITGQLIISELRKKGYNVTPIYINKEGEWLIDDRLGCLKYFTDSERESNLTKIKKWNLKLAANTGKMTFQSDGIFPEKITIDLAFPAFHGANGEDGTIQGLFQLMNIPYVGCDVLSSALAMDKVSTKLIYRGEKIPSTEFIFFEKHEWENNQRELIDKVNNLRWPVFVKPARLGSSIGITKVKLKEELVDACEVALHYDDKIIVEESVENMSDITCAVIGNEITIASLVQEAVFSGDHFNYEDKYLEDGGTQLGNNKNSLIIPANISEEKTREVQDLAQKIYKIFGCSGIARIDFLYEKSTQKVFANEINTLPGTLYHHLWKKSGIEIDVLLEKLINYAVEKYESRKKITSSFDSDLLKFANSVKLNIKDEL